MGHIAVAVPASHAFSSFGHHIVYAASFYKFGVELSVAAYTVVHNNLGRSILGPYGLMLAVGYKIGYVLHAIDALKAIVGCHVVVGHMAVVARGIAGVR